MASSEIIRLAMMYVRFPLSLRKVEDLLHEHRIDISHERVRFWRNRFSPLMALEIKKRRSQQLRQVIRWRRHLDEVFAKINGETGYLWKAVDHEGEALEFYVTRTRDRDSALKFLRKAMKRCRRPEEVVTDTLRSYRTAMNEIGNAARRITGRHENNSGENSIRPFRRRERAMARLRRMRSLQKFAATHACVQNQLNHDRSIKQRGRFKTFAKPRLLSGVSCRLRKPARRDFGDRFALVRQHSLAA